MMGMVARLGRGEANAVNTMHTRYEVHLRGVLDDGLAAFLAEYDLGGLQADLVLRGVQARPAVLRAIPDRAEALGVSVVDVRSEAL
jgi:hypothetical protein